MSVSFYKIKKWTKMLMRKSISHVDQGVGKLYSIDNIEGYYNNLIEKVTKRGNLTTVVPMSSVDTGERIYFSIEIFQYGLGAYDLYLMNHEDFMLQKVIDCTDWAVEHQQKDGSWVTFAYENPEHPYSSMAQGEGISLLLRAYKATNNPKYLNAAKKAKDFMLMPIENGGTTKYIGDNIYFYECTHDPLILNGWIFSLWGIWDYCKFTKDEQIQKILDKTLLSLEKKLPEFDIKYWSKYEDGKRICSPFYHKLHIAQLRVMYDLTGHEIYSRYVDRWDKYQNSFWKRKRAFAQKALQKIFE